MPCQMCVLGGVTEVWSARKRGRRDDPVLGGRGGEVNAGTGDMDEGQKGYGDFAKR